MPVTHRTSAPAAPAPRRAARVAAAVCTAAACLILLATGAPAGRARSTAAAPSDRRALLDRFNRAASVADKLALLPGVNQAFAANELPPEARYLSALVLLRPHLSWHAGFPVPRPDGLRDVARRARDEWDGASVGWRWMPAHPGEAWMAGDARPHAPAGGAGEPEGRFWLVTEPSHPDVARALALLDGVDEHSEVAPLARRWAADVRRNNTVLTFDAVGRYDAGQDGPVVMDARSARTVNFTLYRVKSAADLMAVARRVGEDFTFRDYGLQGPRARRADQVMQMAVQQQAMTERRAAAPPPDLSRLEVVGQWGSIVADLPAVGDVPGDEDEWEDWADEGQDEEADYFDDACAGYHDRIVKSYRPEPGADRRSSWQCDRVVEVPGRFLAGGGAYVLAGEANGQVAVAPLLVDPPMLTLRRCRDGVFAAVSSADGSAPEAGARVTGAQNPDEAVTDAHGIAFAKLFAGGDVPIVAATAGGRFAVGGFGRLFEGVYVSRPELEWRRTSGPVRELQKMQQLRQVARNVAQVYADRYVVAAYTDRPTYRPGQEVRFKLIVRRLKDAGPATRPAIPATRPAVFREDDFNFASRLECPAEGEPVTFTVLSPRGRAVAGGDLRLNDFGTAAGTFDLSAEEAAGEYTLRVGVGGEQRVVPDVFAVKSYRRPNFELRLTGVPARAGQAAAFEAALAGDYYFGKPVAGGRAEVRLVGADRQEPLARAQGVLDGAGRGTVRLEPPAGLAPGKYAVVASLTDDSGRIVTASAPYEVGPAPEAGQPGGLASLPPFADAAEPLVVRSTAARLVVESPGAGDRRIVVEVKDGVARVRFPSPGWYDLSDGGARRRVFAFGGDAAPPWEAGAGAAPEADGPRWVNLSDYRAEADDEDGRTGFDLWDDADSHLLALFERQQVNVGGRLRVLVFVPGGEGRLLFTIEGRTVLDYFVAEVRKGPNGKAGSYRVVEIPVTNRMLPDFYLQGRILRGGSAPEAPAGQARPRKQQEAREQKQDQEQEGEDPRWCRVDVVDPDALPAGQALRVEVRPDRRDCRPGEDVAVTLRVTGADGAPREAEVSLSAVDESVFGFGEDRGPAAAGTFGSARPDRLYLRKTWRSGPRLVERELAVHQRAMEAMQKAAQQVQQQAEAAAQSLDQARQVNDAPPAGPPARLPPAAAGGMLPVTGFPLSEVRGDFRETATWQPQLRTGNDGIARATFRLPDSLTAWRLTAVGLTRATEAGSGSSSLRTAKPLSAQVFVPRFMVEKDRLRLIALIHNDTGAPQDCEAAWEVEGLAVETPEGWRIDAAARPGDAGGTVIAGRVNVGPHESARVPLWVRADRVGDASVAFHVRGPAGADAERRALPVEALGRPAEAAFNGVVDPATGKAVVRLPAGFVARDLRVSLARSNVGSSLEGIGYLVEYPYGCVEQTMSRFLPAVVVARAVRQSGVALPPEVEARLPDVLGRGLARLYNFQHADGGWGWWEKDATNDGMTVYVVDGLARCRAAGTTVEGDVLTRGCDYLDEKLRQGTLTADLRPRAWLALARAGRADPVRFKAFASALTPADPAAARVEAALACRLMSMEDPSRRLWAGLREGQLPPGTGTDALAERLSARIEFGEPAGDCVAAADALLERRQGWRWESTRATAEAIEALAEAVRLIPALRPAEHMAIRVAGRTVLDAGGGDALRQLVHRVHLAGGQLPPNAGVAIDLEARAPERTHYAVTATGTQRLDRVEATGGAVKLTRRYESVDGQPVEGPVPAGTVLAVRLTLDLAGPAGYLMVEDRRPAACEFADDRLAGPEAAAAANVEFRDDRVSAFFTALPAGRHELVYYLRAETAGTSHVLPGCAYPMYDERSRGETASAGVEVKE